MRARNIKPGFFKNEELSECSPWARLCFAGLWLLADREGRLEDRPKRIKGELFAFECFEVEPLLDELALHGFIVRYVVGAHRLIQIAQFLKHQSPHRLERPSVLPPPPDLGPGPASTTPKSEASPSSNRADASESDAVQEPGASVSSSLHGTKASDSPPLAQASNREKVGCTPPSDGGRIHLNPDSLNPDSLNPDSGEEKHAAHAPTRPLAEVGGLALVERKTPRPEPRPDPDPSPEVEQPDPLPDCPHREVLALWAEVLPAMPQHIPSQWKGARADHLRARWRETAAEKGWRDKAQGMTYLRKLFAYVGQSAFLTGQVRAREPGKRPFVIELEWLVNPTNWAKVIEGKYHQEAA